MSVHLWRTLVRPGCLSICTSFLLVWECYFRVSVGVISRVCVWGLCVLVNVTAIEGNFIHYKNKRIFLEEGGRDWQGSV